MGETVGVLDEKPPATLRDIALACGVSVPTVSKVLNGRGTVSVETKRRILDAAERLDFRPNGLAKAFASGRSLTVGILAQNATSAVASRVIAGVADELSRHDIAILIYDDHDDPSGVHNYRSRGENIRTLQSRRVDGVLVISDGNDSIVESVSSSFSCPVVNVYSLSKNPSDTCFVPDDERAGFTAARHLLDSGRTRIAHVTGAEISPAASSRWDGIRAALDGSGFGLALEKPLFGNWSIKWGEKAAKMLVERAGEFDAILCGNDFIATGIARMFDRVGIRVPDDVALIGFDNRAQYDSLNADDFLTTMDPRLIRLGRLAAQAIIAEGKNSSSSGIVREPYVLVPGLSTTHPGTRSIPTS